ncbi:hypothetical protein ACH4TX_45800 [Streptomyces sp. NPDC021098]|uniref:hypothetical protein n=1 Tax=unclassified Streptomyces TaxID=2593676 RepID=UPI0037AFB58C
MDPARIPGTRPETFTWPELLQELGPVTEPPVEWSHQHGDVVEALCETASEMDDLLFHDVGAYVVGTEIPIGSGEDDDDGDLVDRATAWADRLEDVVDKLRAAVSAGTVLHDEVITALTQALADAGLNDSHAKRGPNGETSVHLSPADAEQLGAMLAVKTTSLSASLKEVGVKVLGGYSGESHTVYLTDDGGRMLVELLREPTRWS